MAHYSYTMKNPERHWYIAGVAAAVTIPVVIGIIVLWPIIHGVGITCWVLPGNECINTSRMANRYPFRMPIGLTFVFGSLLAAVLGVQRVSESIDRLKSGRAFAGIGVVSAIWAQLICGVIHLTMFIWGSAAARNSLLNLGDKAAEFSGLFAFAALIHLALWVCITLPLSMVCGWIFSRVSTDRNLISDGQAGD